MNARKFSLVLALVAFSASSVFAQGDFFWSFADLNGGATNSSAFKTFTGFGDTGSAFLYYDTANPELDTAAFLCLATSLDGVIEITNAETFDYNVTVGPGGPAVGVRWGESFGPGDVGADGQTAMINAFTVVEGDGIVDVNKGPVFIDEGYDFAADAFLFARVDFEVVGNGTTRIDITPGAGGIVNAGQTVDATFGTITICAFFCPDTGTFGLFAISLIGMVSRRRR